MKSIQTHQFDPFLEISHKCRLTVHFNKIQNIVANPIALEFPIIITDYPATAPDSVSDFVSPSSNNSTHSVQQTNTVSTGGDDAVGVDLDLPEYTPRYEESSSSSILMTN